MKKDTFEIPGEFQLIGHKIKVFWDDHLMANQQSLGVCHFDENKIFLQTAISELNIAEEVVKQTFLHEVVHFMLHLMGEEKLNEDEKFVDLFAQLNYQFLIQLFSE